MDQNKFLKPKKSLGQNAMICDWAITAMCDAARLSPDDTILEIGPGLGALTRELAPRVRRVVAVEKDEYAAEDLGNLLTQVPVGNVNPVRNKTPWASADASTHRISNGVKIIAADILKNFPTIAHDENLEEGKYKVVSNIPYYITGRLFSLLLARGPQPSHIVLTVQKEVAERITASPGRMSMLALSVQAYGSPKIIKMVPASCFSPRPKVDSAIIEISAISKHFFEKSGVSEEKFFQTIRAAFSQKRKFLTNSLAEMSKGHDLASILFHGGISPRARPQELSLDQWTVLTKELWGE